MAEDDRNLVRLAAFEHEHEAVMLRNRLNDQGIPAWVSGGDGVNIFGAGLTAAGLVGVDVNIPQIDLETAQAVLAELKKEEEIITPSWVCQCGEEVDEGFAVCWSCGAEFEQD